MRPEVEIVESGSNYQEKKTGKLAEDGVINLNALDVSALGEGYHYFNFRTQDSFGVWSSPVSYYFYRLVTPIPEVEIVESGRKCGHVQFQ